jgi:hypothetical protein
MSMRIDPAMAFFPKCLHKYTILFRTLNGEARGAVENTR